MKEQTNGVQRPFRILLTIGIILEFGQEKETMQDYAWRCTRWLCLLYTFLGEHRFVKSASSPPPILFQGFPRIHPQTQSVGNGCPKPHQRLLAFSEYLIFFASSQGTTHTVFLPEYHRHTRCKPGFQGLIVGRWLPIHGPLSTAVFC